MSYPTNKNDFLWKKPKLQHNHDMTSYFLCASSDLGNDQSLGFNEPFALFIIRKNNHVYGYKNSCPHVGAPLDWQPNQFLNHDLTLIQCAMHGALFTPENGQCISGPCNGQALTPINIEDTGKKFDLICNIDGLLRVYANPSVRNIATHGQNFHPRLTSFLQSTRINTINMLCR